MVGIDGKRDIVFLNRGAICELWESVFMRSFTFRITAIGNLLFLCWDMWVGAIICVIFLITFWGKKGPLETSFYPYLCQYRSMGLLYSFFQIKNEKFTTFWTGVDKTWNSDLRKSENYYIENCGYWSYKNFFSVASRSTKSFKPEFLNFSTKIFSNK